MSTDIVPVQAQDIEKLLLGDLSKLSQQDRTSYFMKVCDSLGLNPLTKPFEYIQLNGKLTLYATKNCAEQLRKIYNVSITNMDHVVNQEVLTVRVSGRDHTGREDISSASISLSGLKGEALANAYMKCETKAKRRLTLSICSLGMLDETEIESIPNARRVDESAPLPPAAAQIAPPSNRPRFGVVLKQALAGKSKPFSEFTLLVFDTMAKYYDELKPFEGLAWEEKGAAMGKVYDSLPDEEKDAVVATIRNLATMSDVYPEAELVA